MSPVALSIGILFLSATRGPAAPAPEKEPPPVVATAKKLANPVRFPGWDKDERMTLQDALDRLTELYELRFAVNEHAFKAEVPPVPEVLNTPVVSREALPKMDKVPLETVLRRANVLEGYVWRWHATSKRPWASRSRPAQDRLGRPAPTTCSERSRAASSCARVPARLPPARRRRA